MPRKFDRRRIARTLGDLQRELGNIEVMDVAPPEGGATAPVALQVAMPTNEGGDELLAVTAMPTGEGEDELLTISILAK